jgi:hypothetical protein
VSRGRLTSPVALPAETGPDRAPDRLSLWPLEGGAFGIDATYQGATGLIRADAQFERLTQAGLPAQLRQEPGGACTLRLGPLAYGAAWAALEAFLGPKP